MRKLEKASLPNEDIWPEILEVADKYNDAATLAAIATLLSIKSKVGKKFIKVIESNDDRVLNNFLDNVTLDGKKLKVVEKKLVKDVSELINNKYNFGVNIKELAIDKYVDEHVANLVVQVGNETKLAIKEIVRNGWNNGELPEDVYKNIKSVVPLDTRRKNSLIRYEQGLLKNKDLRNRFRNDKEFFKEVARLKEKYHQKLLLDRGRTIGRTENINLANEGSRQMYEASAKQNKDIRNNYELKWVVTPDDRLCNNCRQMINARSSFTGTFENKANVKIVQNGGLRRPTLHPRCLLPGCTVKAPGGGIAIIRQMFSGEAIKFTIANGTQISVTPDHMFLTPNGWAAAKLLRKGDNIIYCPIGDESRSPNNNRCESTIENIFNTLAVTCGMSTGIMPTATEDLNGNWRFDDSNVDIVRTDCFLRNTVKSPIDKHIANVDFKRSYDTAKSFLLCDSDLTSMINRLRNSSDCIMCGSRESASFFRARLGHSQKHSIPSFSRGNSVFIENSNNNRSSTIEFFRKHLNGIPGIIELNEIVAIDSSFYHGYVYDVQSISTLLICNGILTSNCRCCIVCVKK